MRLWILEHWLCQTASLIALEDTDVSLQVKVTLLDAWAIGQNPSKDMEQEFIAYLPHMY